MNHRPSRRIMSFKEFVAHPLYEVVKAEQAFRTKYGKKKSPQKTTRNTAVNTIKDVLDHNWSSVPLSPSNSGKIEIGGQMTIPERG